MTARAMAPAFFAELPAVVRALDADPDVRAIVVTGAEGRFSYGLDLRAATSSLGGVLSDPTAGAREEFLHHVRDLQAAITAVADCRTPIVAAVQGWCVGGGVDLATACDVRLASAEHLASTLGDRYAPPQLLRDKVASGELGRKSGRGFFDWEAA